MIVRTALADFEGSATLVAVTLTVFGLGTEEGAEYIPSALMLPVVALPAPPLIDQATAVFAEPVTVAVSATVPPARTFEAWGVTCTLTFVVFVI